MSIRQDIPAGHRHGPRTRPPCPPRRRAGLTLVELLLAVTISAIIGAAMATMLLAVSTGTSSHRKTRSLAVAHGVVAERLGAAVRVSRTVLAREDDLLVLWVPGLSTSSTPALSELRRIELDSSSGELACYRVPPEVLLDPDPQYDPATTDFDDVTETAKGKGTLAKQLWATGVQDWAVALDREEPRQARFVSYRLTLHGDGGSETTTGATTLRN